MIWMNSQSDGEDESDFEDMENEDEIIEDNDDDGEDAMEDYHFLYLAPFGPFWSAQILTKLASKHSLKTIAFYFIR